MTHRPRQLISFFLRVTIFRAPRICLGWLVSFALLFVPPTAMAASFTVDTVTAPMTGLWWNPNESGWGMSIEQQGPIMFIGWYTYDQSGNSARYYMSNCAVSGNSCTGDIGYISGGAAPTVPWTGRGPSSVVGTGTVAFSDVNTAVFSFVLNGVVGSKNIVRMAFGAPITPPAADYTALWWNPNESGWGVFLAHQSSTIFAVLFTYDAFGNPMRYVASNCAVSGNGCTGTLFKTSGGSAPTVPWVGPITQTPVGTITLAFADASNATMSFTIDGQPGAKAISKMVFYTAPATTTQNVVPLLVDAGPLDSSGNPVGSLNMPYVSVTICKPGSATQCQTIDHVEVDTGSSGLRILSSALSSSLGLAAVNDAHGNPLAECLQFADGYTWGSVKQADIHIGGETASRMSIHIVGDNAFPKVPSACSNGLSAENTVASFGANGLIGVGVFKQDCGQACAAGIPPGGAYYTCPGGICQPASVSLASQVNNPVASFSGDNNGTLIQLPAIGANGAATAAGSLIFGIGTRPNNGLGSARVYTLDTFTGNFGTAYKGRNYAHSFVDSGSNGLFFPDSSIALCSDGSGFYCPASAVNLSAVNTGANGATGTVNFTVANVELSNPSFTAFSNLGGSSGALSGLSTSFDWGLPFFFGRSVFTAIEGINAAGTVGPYVAY